MRIKVTSRRSRKNAPDAGTAYAEMDGQHLADRHATVWYVEAVDAEDFVINRVRAQDVRLRTGRTDDEAIIDYGDGALVFSTPTPSMIAHVYGNMPSAWQADVAHLVEAAAPAPKPTPVIVSRHAATIAWLRATVPALADAPVLVSATPSDVCGRTVYGNIPLHLAAEASMVWAVEFTGDAPRGAEYTAKDMEAAGVRLAAYVVHAIP